MKFVSLFKASRFLALATMLVLSGGMSLADPGHGRAGVTGKPGKAADVTRTIAVVLRDSLFDRHEIDVRPGETVRFVLKNEGELLHEFNIGSPRSHAQHQKEMMRMMEMGMLTHSGANPARMNAPRGGTGHGAMTHDDPNSILVEPGQTRELIWKFGNGPNLEFACNLPGHYQAGMVGRFLVAGQTR